MEFSEPCFLLTLIENFKKTKHKIPPLSFLLGAKPIKNLKNIQKKNGCMSVIVQNSFCLLEIGILAECQLYNSGIKIFPLYFGFAL